MIWKSNNEVGKFSYQDMECPRQTRPLYATMEKTQGYQNLF